MMVCIRCICDEHKGRFLFMIVLIARHCRLVMNSPYNTQDACSPSLAYRRINSRHGSLPFIIQHTILFRMLGAASLLKGNYPFFTGKAPRRIPVTKSLLLKISFCEYHFTSFRCERRRQAIYILIRNQHPC